MAVCCWTTPCDLPAGEAELAFPGAEGFAAHATGGRGGDICHVNNLEDSGPGSLRDAVSKGPRIVVFDVGGYVNLKSTLHVSSDVTIEGQTAPGLGIGTRNYEVSFSDSHNVIVRYVRFRQGDTPHQERKSAVNITKGRNILMDHVSIEWGRWDTVDMNDSSDVTIQYLDHRRRGRTAAVRLPLPERSGHIQPRPLHQQPRAQPQGQGEGPVRQ